MYVTPAAQGQQWAAELAISDRVEGCEATYTVQGLFPAVSCVDTPLAAPVDAEAEEAVGCSERGCIFGTCDTSLPSPTCVFPCSANADCPSGALCMAGECTIPADIFCSPVGHPEIGMALGSGISPDFPVTCDTAFDSDPTDTVKEGMCFPTKGFPAVK